MHKLGITLVSDLLKAFKERECDFMSGICPWLRNGLEEYQQWTTFQNRTGKRNTMALLFVIVTFPHNYLFDGCFFLFILWNPVFRSVNKI